MSYRRFILPFFDARKYVNFCTKNYCSQTILPNANENSDPCKFLKEIDYKFFVKKPNYFLFSQLDDRKISKTEWNTICRYEDDTDIASRVPALLLEGFSKSNKMNLIHSFLSYMLQNSFYHKSTIILSTIIFISNYNNNEYFEEFINIYHAVVSEKEYKVFYYVFIKAYLISKMRGDALKLVLKEERTPSILYYIICTSPGTESLSVLMPFIIEFCEKLDGNIVSNLVDIIFKKISDIESLKIILDLLSKNGMYVWLSNIEVLQHLSKSLDFSLTLNTVTSLSCNECGAQLPKTVVDRKKCHELANILMTDFMKIHPSIELLPNSSTQEMVRFEKFMTQNPMKFDCVIDLTNVMNVRKIRDIHSKNNNMHTRIMKHIVEYLIHLQEESPVIENIFLVGRYIKGIIKDTNGILHEFNQYILDYQKKSNVKMNIYGYFGNHYIKDDLLALYVALKSGPDCFIVTNDEYRDRKARIKETHTQLAFTNWQNSRQIMINKDIHCQSKYFLPDPYMKSISFDRAHSTYHIPYVNEKEDKSSFSRTVGWACLKLK